MTVKLKEELLKTLEDLREEEFDKFKWYLKQDGVLEGLSGIPVAQLEKATRHYTVDLMVQKYQGPGATKVTTKILEKIGRNDLVLRFQNFSIDVPRKEEIKRKNPKLKWVQQFAVEVTLDPDTAHPHLILSGDGKQVHHGDVRKKLPDNPQRFDSCTNVLGKQSFSSGRFYYEVQVTDKTAWTLGVAKESIERKGDITLSPERGFWTMWLRNGDKYKAIDESSVNLSLKSYPQKVGVFVDYEKGLVSFYDVDAADLLYSFTGCYFTEKIYPYFSPCTNNGSRNSAPLIISPVNRPLNLKKHEFGDQKEYERKKAELMTIQQFAVEVTLDPDTAHPKLILWDDRKQVSCGDVNKNLPDNAKRFKKCVNILGRKNFSSGKSYFEVQVRGKTAWTVGVAKESINRGKDITLSPEDGYWTICLENDDEYKANDNTLVQFSLNDAPQKVGVFVDYEEGLVSFYDVHTADLLYSFTGCSFTEKIYPFFSPCNNDGGRNSAPLIISPVSPGGQKEDYERKKAELMRVQQFAVEVTLDPDTAHPDLILSGDGKQVHDSDVRKKLPDNPQRFDRHANILGKQSFSSGRFYYEVQVKGKTAWTLGVAKESIERKGSITLSPERGFWTMWLRNGDEYKAIDESSVNLSLKSHPQKVGVFVDYEEGLVSFYDVDAADLLYSFTGCSFTEKIYPYFSPCTNNGGRNSAPLIISPVSPGGQKEDRERKKAELMRVQQFAVEVTLDPDTAHPKLILSGDGKQVHHGDVRKTLPENPKRFNRCVNVLGEQGFSSGKSYFEVQVKGKTAWTVGVAKESINRGKDVTLSPEDGYWTMWLRNDEYEAIDDPSVHLSLSHHPQKVGVFVDYEEGLVSFYDVDAADLLYSFTGCSFTEKIYPYFSPCTNNGGRNSAPLIISPVSPGGQKEDYQRKKAELMRVQRFAVEVTLDPDTAHPDLILSGDGKQVHDSDVRKKLPDNPQRFDRHANILGKQSFSSGRFYYEVQVKGKTKWTLGVAKESIERKGSITLSPERGFWTMWLRNGDEYEAIDDPSVHLSLSHHPQKVGVFVDYEEGLVSFYDVDAADLLYSFTGCSFTEKIYPYFSPCSNDGGRNSAPLIISPVSPGGQKEDCERKKAELMRVQQFAVEVTLDPDTAHPKLILSGDGKQVHHGEVRKPLPENSKRFDSYANVLGKQSFSSGKSYFEVQVKGKTKWDLGVAKESINRGKNITLSPEDGYWMLWLRNDEYEAIDDPSVHLSLSHHPQKVGVFVDYEEGLVSFYDVDTADLLYSFTGCSFTEKIYPFFSPCSNDGGINSAPLIISPVYRPH
ncbi:uncharacterized protein PEZ65_021286 [Lycodopsis pacificus]